ncbi:MAG: hypothetical protein Q8P66_01665 [Candidatus Colwellbacteria bacterium]|nr:hypothetical protein [Candidatus Colwellbacteria bacterium]
MFSKTTKIKYLVPLGLAVAVAGGAVSLALADDDQDRSSHRPAMILEVNRNGKTLLRGTVESVASSTLTLKSWGGNWTIKTSSDTKIHPRVNGTSTLSAFETGDFVGVIGQVSETENFTVNAKIIRNWTLKKEVKTDKQEGKKEVKEAKKEGAKLFVGVAGNVASSSLTLNSKNKIYSVLVASSTKILNRHWLNINLSNIRVNDKIRIFGILHGTSTTDIDAEVIRDISLP